MGLAESVYALLNRPAGVGVIGFDGSRVEHADDRVTIVFRRPEAIARLLRTPGELGVARAYISGDLDLEGDLFVMAHLFLDDQIPLAPTKIARLLASAGPAAWRSAISPPPAPPEEVRLHGRLHSSRRDADAVAHHYDVSNAFYELMLGPSMTYSCAIFERPDESLEAAQDRKVELICAKLGLEPGMRLLDVGCGWGELLIHAAARYGVEGVGITISRQQAVLASKRVAAAGLADRIEIRLQDYRDIDDGPYDAISSIGMFEHVGRAGIEAYARTLASLLAGGGRLLNHAIGRPVVSGNDPHLSPFRNRLRRVQIAVGSSTPSRVNSVLMQRYVFPDGELHELGDTVTLMHEVGLEVRHIENFREHYALTLRHWLANLDAHWSEAVDEVGEARARVWKLYMTACAIGFERHTTEVHQLLAVKPDGGYRSGIPLRPHFEP